MPTSVMEPRSSAALAADPGIATAMLEPCGEGVAKVRLEAEQELPDQPCAKCVLVGNPVGVF